MSNFQQDKKCPYCHKRKVYVRFDEDRTVYYCTACGREWGE